MIYKIFENGEHVDTIVADYDFIIQYCKDNNYSYELVEDESTTSPEPDPVELLQAQLKAAIDRQEFLEDCIVEMATKLYS